MSNDAKLWAWRFAVLAIILTALYMLYRMWGDALDPHGHVVVWAVLFFVLMVGSLPVGFKYTLAKSRRWESQVDEHRDNESVLNAYGRQLAAEKKTRQQTIQPPRKNQ